MRTVLTISLVAVVVISCAWAIFFLTASFRWNPRDYRCALLTEDVTLKGQGTDLVIGYLRKGAVLFAPTKDDMAVTDPGDIALHKVYVRLPADMIDRLVLLPPKKAGTNVPQTICNVLEAIPQDLKGTPSTSDK